MNYIENIFNQLSLIKGFNFLQKIKQLISDNQAHFFSIIE